MANDRTTNPDVHAAARFQTILEGTLLPTPNSTELARSYGTDYLLRFDARAPHVAELFQENTKLTRGAMLSRSIDAGRIEEAREWYFSTAYRMREGNLKTGRTDPSRIRHEDLPVPVRTLASFCSKAASVTTLLYAVDILFLYGGTLLRVLPRGDFLWLERRMTSSEESNLRSAGVHGDTDAIWTAPFLAFVVAVPWRYMLFYGPRGYRRMLLEAGAVLAQLHSAEGSAGLKSCTHLDFYDRCVDDALMLDGVERTVVAVMSYEGEGL